MLTAAQIDALRDRSGQLLDPITDFLIEDIAKRVSEAGQFTGTASYQAWKLQKLGVSQRQLKKEIAKRLKISQKEAEQLLTQAAETGYNFDMSRFPTSHAIPLSANFALQQILDATVKLAKEDLTNMTQTIGFVGPDGQCRELTDAYIQACDFAFQKVSTGAQDYVSAVREATANLAKEGIRTIDYESGVHTSLEAAVRRNIMGGLGLMQEKISERNPDLLGCDGWEISAHAASAPDHEPIQGKQYTDEEYTLLNNSLVRRIGTLHCEHIAFGIILGVHSPQYTPEELENLRLENEEGITYNGKHYTRYEAIQRQRKFERAIRDRKRRILIDEKLGDKDKLQTDQIRLQVLKQEYARFSKAAGLPMQHARMEAAGFTWKHGNAAESVAQKAMLAENERSAGFGVGTPKANLEQINSSEYKAKFDKISDDAALNDAIYKRAKAAVTHQSGDYFEDLAVIGPQGELVGFSSSKVRNETLYTESLKKKISSYPEHTLVAVHNHGTNTPPSGADLVSAGHKRYKFGVVACNDGKVYVYDMRGATPFTPAMFDKTVDKYRAKPYDKGEVEAYVAALTQFEKDYGVKWREL